MARSHEVSPGSPSVTCAGLRRVLGYSISSLLDYFLTVNDRGCGHDLSGKGLRR
jgi:hypothetical protein